jgi:hypothetical protein
LVKSRTLRASLCGRAAASSPQGLFWVKRDGVVNAPLPESLQLAVNVPSLELAGEK